MSWCHLISSALNGQTFAGQGHRSCRESFWFWAHDLRSLRYIFMMIIQLTTKLFKIASVVKIAKKVLSLKMFYCFPTAINVWRGAHAMVISKVTVRSCRSTTTPSTAEPSMFNNHLIDFSYVSNNDACRGVMKARTSCSNPVLNNQNSKKNGSDSKMQFLSLSPQPLRPLPVDGSGRHTLALPNDELVHWGSRTTRKWYADLSKQQFGLCPLTPVSRKKNRWL